MIVALARISLHIPQSHSLKEKRAVIRKIVDRTRARFGVHLAEVDGQDTWQRAVLGFAVVGSEARTAEALRDDVLRSIEGLGAGETIALDRDTLRFAEEERGWK